MSPSSPLHVLASAVTAILALPLALVPSWPDEGEDVWEPFLDDVVPG